MRANRFPLKVASKSGSHRILPKTRGITKGSLKEPSCYRIAKRAFPAVLVALLFLALLPSYASAAEIPKLVQKDGRYALMVDGRHQRQLPCPGEITVDAKRDHHG
jgi:hypothetical protein